MLNCPYFREQGGGTPRCAEFRENSRRSVCLPACRGRWATLAWLGGGVRSDDVGDYRTMAFIKSIAFTPSVMGFWPMTAPPTQGSLFLCPGRRSVDFCCSGIVTQRAGHAHAPTLKNGSAYRPSSVAPKGVTPSPRGRLFCASPGGFLSRPGEFCFLLYTRREGQSKDCPSGCLISRPSRNRHPPHRRRRAYCRPGRRWAGRPEALRFCRASR